MFTGHIDCARPVAAWAPHIRRQRSPISAPFAAIALVLLGMLPAVPPATANGLASATYFQQNLDRDGNGVEDLLDDWMSGQTTWQELRETASPAGEAPRHYPFGKMPAQKVWSRNQVRVIFFGSAGKAAEDAEEMAAQVGECRLIHDLDFLHGIRVLALDAKGLKTYLSHKPEGRIALDRAGVPALSTSTIQMGARQLQNGPWNLGEDWSATVAILDSGCDTAHNDLGDKDNDNADGPPPFVGDSHDWSSSENGWPINRSYRVVGWKDVSDDFPQAVGPWDYHHHGTALASVVAGSGAMDPDQAGVAPGARLTIVKFYDFDQIWHAWAGDFLAACEWTLEQREVHRIKVVLSAVNWEVDLGISDAMNAFVAAGILPVAAMGNFGAASTGPGFPAAVPDVLTIGAVNSEGAVTTYSGRGLPGQGKPEMLAPGGATLVSRDWIPAADNEPNDSYSPRQGTSLAAAHTAGAAYLLLEALRDNGVLLPAEAMSVRTLRALLMGTAARVDRAEGPSGENDIVLDPQEDLDEIRGWGSLRADAAVSALFQPLHPGAAQEVTLTSDQETVVIARRLILQPDIRYRVDVSPAAGLDVDVRLVDPRQLDHFSQGNLAVLQNDGGAGVPESLHHEAAGDRWAFLVVRRVSGSGTVQIHLLEDDSFSTSGREVLLPGTATGAPNFGQFPLATGTCVAIPSLVELDSQAHSMNVFDGQGYPLPGWPVYLFPSPSSQGGLTQPMFWDMDGVSGDEIVASSDFGGIYFFNHLGGYDEIALPFNVSLTPVVGWEVDDSPRRAVIIDEFGRLRAYSWGPQEVLSRDLEHTQPLLPAVGRLHPSFEERLVVAFADGYVFALDSAGENLPGWPVDLGEELKLPPVLLDLNGDSQREIVLPVWDESNGQLKIRLLSGSGLPLAGDGTLLAPPEGQKWLQMSAPVVAGRRLDGNLRLEIQGVVDNGLSGEQAHRHLARAGWYASGDPFAERLPHLQFGSTTEQGHLQDRGTVFAPPLAWDYRGSPGSDVALLAGLNWRELIYGQTAIFGSTTGWFLNTGAADLLSQRPPVLIGGSEEGTPTHLFAALVPLQGDAMKLVQVHDKMVQFLPMRPRTFWSHFWPTARCDQRNTGAYPLAATYSSVPRPSGGQLDVFPNPGAGRFSFRWKSDAGTAPARLTIYDLRGRQVAEIRAQDDGGFTWDGRDLRGRPAAAGAYLAVARREGSRSVVRLVLTR